MILSFDQVLDCGDGRFPQCVHDPYGNLRIIYLTQENLVHCREAVPELGIYDDLVFKEMGQISPDTVVSYPSIKKVAHHGAFGFWSSAGDHKFVIYMMPTDTSKAFLDGSASFSATSEVSSLSASFINVHGLLLNKYRALVTPGTKIEIYFSIGGSDETTLGVFYVDRASISYPECNLTISARNAVGKLLKEQTFDEHTVFDEGSLHDNVSAILEYAGIEDYFVGDASTGEKLEFDPDTTLQEGINYAITLASNWKLGETLDGRVGVANKNDSRFDPPSVYTFERDHTCWSYSIEFDDSDAASRVCVYSKGANEDDPVVRAYVNVTFNKWWAQPTHRTTHVKTVNGATLAQVTQLAETIAEALSVSGRVESFAGIFTPQLTIGDEVRLIDEHGAIETIGAVTDIKHSFGKSGFFTTFSADSGGKKGRTTLKDLINTVASYPEAFTGHQGRSEPVSDVVMKNTMALEVTDSTSISATFFTIGAPLVVACVVHRSTIGPTPSGWTWLHTTSGLDHTGTLQYVSIYYAFTTQASVSPTFTQASAGRMYLNLMAFENAGTPMVLTGEQTVGTQQIILRKNTSEAALWIAHRIMWSSGPWTVDGVGSANVVQLETNGRLLSIFDSTMQKTITISASSGNTEDTEFMALCIPKDYINT